MKKITSLFIIGISALAGILFANISALASNSDIINISEIILDNSDPERCDARVGEQGQRSGFPCERFRLARGTVTGIEAFVAEFSFNDGTKIKFLVVNNNNAETVEENGEIFTRYPALMKIVEVPGEESWTENESVTGCRISEDYSQILCVSSNGIYLYEGNAISSTAVNSNSATANSGNVRQYTFNTRSHVNTGVSVNPGDVVTIQASGTIRFGLFAGSGGPRGIIFNPEYNYFIDIPHGQLIGRVKAFGMPEFDGWFSVAEGTRFVVPNQGILEFAVNDNRPSDNAGAFQIEVTIESQ
jgi:hypothetical protein